MHEFLRDQGLPVTQVPHLDAIVVPICGAGMTSGIAVAAKGLKPDMRIIAAEPSGAARDTCSAHTDLYLTALAVIHLFPCLPLANAAVSCRAE